MDATADECASCLVLESVAEARGISTTNIRPPLYEAIDPDALDALFDDESGATRHLSVEFTFSGCVVTVRGGDSIVVRTTPVDTSESERGVASSSR